MEWEIDRQRATMGRERNELANIQISLSLALSLLSLLKYARPNGLIIGSQEGPEILGTFLRSRLDICSGELQG